jgi:hypothetical protein
MSDDRPTIDLTYIGRALDRLTQEIATMREQMIVQTASIIRLDNTVSGQGAELRALISLTNRMLDRLRRVEERVDALKDRGKIAPNND